MILFTYLSYHFGDGMEIKMNTIVAAKIDVGKNKEISFIRLISLGMIVVCHIMQYYDFVLAWWFNVGVQIFLCISGFLYGQKNIRSVTKFYHQRIKKILIPYYLVILPFAIFEFLFKPTVIDFGKFTEAVVLHSRLKGAEHLWFIPTILMCYLITPLLQNYRDDYVKSKESWYKFSLFSVILISSFFGIFNNFFDPACISCYALGYALGANEKVSEVKNSYLIVLLGIIAVVGNSVQIYCEYIAHISFSGCKVIYDYNHVALGTVIFLGLKQFLNI